MGVTHDQPFGVERGDVVEAELHRQRPAKTVLADETRGQKLGLEIGAVPPCLPGEIGGLVKRHKETLQQRKPTGEFRIEVGYEERAGLRIFRREVPFEGTFPDWRRLCRVDEVTKRHAAHSGKPRAG